MSVRWEHEIRNKCVHGVVLSKNANETNSDCDARTQVCYWTFKRKSSLMKSRSEYNEKKKQLKTDDDGLLTSLPSCSLFNRI